MFSLYFFCYILNFYLPLRGREKLLLLKRKEGKIAKIFIKLLVTRGWELPVYNPRENSEILVKPCPGTGLGLVLFPSSSASWRKADIGEITLSQQVLGELRGFF